ncbi:Hypothetical predicted protein [Pelobates cultripes]|uniref:Uncharacterized protein n=1 Tax=Pelobates cultripes TaxID=61616 RepID=A0AAD1SI29_PELCU|nr:Hypothetical predicted protein [Pelobates cultripes]
MAGGSASCTYSGRRKLCCVIRALRPECHVLCERRVERGGRVRNPGESQARYWGESQADRARYRGESQAVLHRMANMATKREARSNG